MFAVGAFRANVSPNVEAPVTVPRVKVPLLSAEPAPGALMSVKVVFPEARPNKLRLMVSVPLAMAFEFALSEIRSLVEVPTSKLSALPPPRVRPVVAAVLMASVLTALLNRERLPLLAVSVKLAAPVPVDCVPVPMV